MKNSIKLMADYECYPLWGYDNLGLVGNLDPTTLPLSQKLIERLDSWSDLYDKTLNINDPIRSGFNSSEEELDFVRLGECLAKDLRSELWETYDIIYTP